jgi:hypothetical protein
VAYPLLSAVPWLCTHALGLVTPPAVERAAALRTRGPWDIDRRARRASLLRGIAAHLDAVEAQHHA